MNSPPLDSRNLHHWTDRIFRCLMRSSAPEDAVTAAAAAILTSAHVETATVILFTSASRYVRATGARNREGEIEVGVDSGTESVAALFTADQLFGRLAPHGQAVTSSWPDRLAACLVSSPRAAVPDHLIDIAARILGQASSQQTICPGADHMEAMAEFAAGAGHEINNPLGSIIGQSQLLLKQEQKTDRRQALGTIGAQAWRIRDMIGDCMLFARPPVPELRSSELNSIIREAAENSAGGLDQSHDCLSFRLPESPISIEVDTSQVRTLVSHLVRNSIEACLNGASDAQVTIGLQVEHNGVLLTVRDRGPGVEDDQLRRHLFDPFFSGRQAGRGIGFGLPVCWQIARNHGGLMLCEFPADGGAEFVVGFPRSQTRER